MSVNAASLKNDYEEKEMPHVSNHEIAKAKSVISKANSERSVIKQDQNEIDESIGNKLFLMPGVIQQEGKENCSLSAQPELEAKDNSEQSAIKPDQSEADKSIVSKLLVLSGVIQLETKEHFSDSEQSSIKLDQIDDDKSINSLVEAKEHWADSEQQSTIEQDQSEAAESKVGKLLMQPGPKAKEHFSGSEQNAIKSNQSKADESKGHILKEHFSDSEQSVIKLVQSEADCNKPLMQPASEAREHYSYSDIKKDKSEIYESEVSNLLMQLGPKAIEHFSDYTDSQQSTIKPDKNVADEFKFSELLMQPQPEATDYEQRANESEGNESKVSKLLMQPGPEARADSEQKSTTPGKSEADESKVSKLLVQPILDHLTDSEKSTSKPPDENEPDEFKGNTLLMLPGAREHLSDIEQSAIKPDKSKSDESKQLLQLEPHCIAKEHFSDCEPSITKPYGNEDDGSKVSKQLMQLGSEAKEQLSDNEQKAIKPDRSESNESELLIQPGPDCEAKENFHDCEQDADQSQGDEFKVSKLLFEPGPEARADSEQKSTTPGESEADESKVSKLLVQPILDHLTDSEKSTSKPPDENEPDEFKGNTLLMLPGAREHLSDIEQSAIKPDKSKSDESKQLLQLEPHYIAKEHFSDCEPSITKPYGNEDDGSKVSKQLMQLGSEVKEQLSDNEQKSIKPDRSESNESELLMLPGPDCKAKENFYDCEQDPDQSQVDEFKVSKQPGKDYFSESELIKLNSDMSKGNMLLGPPGLEAKEQYSVSEQSAIKPDLSESEDSEFIMQPNLINMIVDLQSFEKSLEKMLAGKSFTQLEVKSMEKIIIQGIINLHSHYRGKYEDILITILNQNFQEGIHTVEDLNCMHKLYSKERVKFEELRKRNSPPHLQAYLISLVVEICPQNKITLILQQVTQMMEDFYPQIEEYFLEEINKVVHSGSSLHQNLQYFKQFLNQSSSISVNQLSTPLMEPSIPTKLSPKLSKTKMKDSFKNDRKKAAQCLFEKLGLEKLYPMGLQLKDVLCVKSEPLELSLNKLKLTDPKQLVNLILHKLMSYDGLCRSDLMPHKYDENEDEDDEDEDDEDEDGEDEDRIHPVDSLLAIIICSDNFLRQDLFSRLAKCQFSVPFILPDPFSQQLILPLWGMRSIVMNWKTTTSQGIQEYNRPIIKYGMPKISFLRFGEHQCRGASKSEMLNRVISESNHDHFFHRDCPGGQSPLLLGKGLVDMTWYLPFAKHNDSFQDVITFLNLHGDANDHPRQNMFLSRISSMCFILLSEENLKFDEPTIDILRKYSESAGGVTVLNDTKTSSKQLRSVLPIKMKIFKLDKKNEAEITTVIQDRIRKFITSINTQNLKTIEECCSKAIIKDCDFLIDENNDSYEKGLELANEVKSIVHSHKGKQQSAKELMLPLHGELWRSWADKDKEFYQQLYRGKKSVNEYTAEIETAKKNLRDEQLKHVKSQTPVMKSFVESLLKLGEPVYRSTRNYYLQCLKFELNDLSIASISMLQQQYQRARKELSVLQKKTNVREGRVAATDEENKMMKKYKIDMEVFQKDIVNASLGLEHLLRELGQMYEACPVQSSLFQKDIFRLPRAAAELLIDGYPLELMDGDTAHVPLKWVTAVLTEVVDMLKDPKVYVLSVLGLQSSGKSTMLNTAFGLQLNIGSGRCTRGAFMQLLPLDEKLKRESNYSYILVIDTEGLRAPELESTLTQKHDNELATFVIGLANTTLINIYGEVPGDMDDILQTSVHAFLRMNRVRYRKSCQFVHQNAGSSINTAFGSEKFTQKLNRFTVDAAREEGCEGEYETFNDVIKFDNLMDVHHFPGLWKGGPPMAPVSLDYSGSAQNLKYHLINNEVKDKGLSNSLSSFQRKLSDLWEALLKEKFVFSFKNTLEITAYNSLETRYTQWDWKFREEMLKWEQQTENLITTADPNTVSQLVKQSNYEMESLVSNLLKKLQSEMKTFFEEDKQSEILVQWRGRFETKLQSLSGEMKEHAKSQIFKLGEKRAVFSKIDIENTKHMTESVQELIRNMKEEREELNSNLKRRKLEPSQLKIILDQDLFGNKDLEIYKNRKYITGEQEERIKQEILQHGGSMTMECLRKILLGDILSIDEVETILKQGQFSESELKAKFDVDWKKLVDSLPYHDIITEDSTCDIACNVETNLLQYVNNSQSFLQELCDKPLIEWGGDLCLEVVEGTHYKKTNNKIEVLVKKVYKYFNGTITNPHRVVVQEMTDEILNQAKLDLQAFKGERTNYNPTFTQMILHNIDLSISQRQKKFLTPLTQKYKSDIYLTVCGHAIPIFEEIARSFQKRNDPLQYLELEVKEPLFTKFKDQYYQTREEEAIANNICAHLERPIKSQIEKSLGSKVVRQMKLSEQYFNSKMALKFKILTDLYKKNDFKLYMFYISNVKESIEEWLQRYTIEYCDGEVNGDNTRLQKIAREEVSRLIQVVKATCCSISESSRDASTWLKAFCTDVKLRRELGVLLDVNELMEVGVNSIDRLDIENIKIQIKYSTEALEVKLHDSFKSICCEEEMTEWKEKPHVILKTLVGCTEQCPFCGEQCDLIDPDHSDVPHRAMNHSAGCLKGCCDAESHILLTDFCPSQVASNKRFRNAATNQDLHPFKDYKEIYPNWSIPPDVSAGNSLYWMHFISKFKDRLAMWFKVKPPVVPKKWEEIEWPAVEENLKKIYNL